MPNPNSSQQDWYYHAPSKAAQKPAMEPPPASQIPGLSGVINNPDEVDERHFRRKWIRDTDSKYIKLAKAGGRKGLLTYTDPPKPAAEPSLYPRAEWFDHYHPEEEEEEIPPPMQYHTSKRRPQRTEPHRVLPDWYVHDHSSEVQTSHDMGLNAANGKKRVDIMGFDGMSAWEREAREDVESHRQGKLPPLNRRKEPTKSLPKDTFIVKRAVLKLPKIESEPVDFSHLMSFGYQKDWFCDQNQKQSLDKTKKQSERRKNEEKRSSQIRDAIEMRKPRHVTTEEDKPMFKLNRFEKVQPRVESFRI